MIYDFDSACRNLGKPYFIYKLGFGWIEGLTFIFYAVNVQSDNSYPQVLMFIDKVDYKYFAEHGIYFDYYLIYASTLLNVTKIIDEDFAFEFLDCESIVPRFINENYGTLDINLNIESGFYECWQNALAMYFHYMAIREEIGEKHHIIRRQGFEDSYEYKSMFLANNIDLAIWVLIHMKNTYTNLISLSSLNTRQLTIKDKLFYISKVLPKG